MSEAGWASGDGASRGRGGRSERCRASTLPAWPAAAPVRSASAAGCGARFCEGAGAHRQLEEQPEEEEPKHDKLGVTRGEEARTCRRSVALAVPTCADPGDLREERVSLCPPSAIKRKQRARGRGRRGRRAHRRTPRLGQLKAKLVGLDGLRRGPQAREDEKAKDGRARGGRARDGREAQGKVSRHAWAGASGAQREGGCT